MRTDKKIMLLLTLSPLIFLLSGCLVPQGPEEFVLQPNFTEEQRRHSSMPKRFQQPAPQDPTVVESAMELSKKYAKLSEEAAVLRNENQNFISESRRLKDKLASYEAQLQQTQKELAEANDLLIEMRIELNNWKADILGFRGEMRDAEKAQLEALLKILKVLGAEVKTESAQRENADSAATSSNRVKQL